MKKTGFSTIYLAGGCFWGLQAYLDRIQGVQRTQVGYANGETTNPSYEVVCTGITGFVETVEVDFDEKIIDLEKLLAAFFHVIDPTQYHRQGADLGDQYRNGIYCVDEAHQEKAEKILEQVQKKYEKRVVTELEPLKNFYPAEEYHQKYLEKNPKGYCHISVDEAETFNTVE